MALKSLVSKWTTLWTLDTLPQRYSQIPQKPWPLSISPSSCSELLIHSFQWILKACSSILSPWYSCDWQRELPRDVMEEERAGKEVDTVWSAFQKQHCRINSEIRCCKIRELLLFGHVCRSEMYVFILRNEKGFSPDNDILLPPTEDSAYQWTKVFLRQLYASLTRAASYTLPCLTFQSILPASSSSTSDAARPPNLVFLVILVCHHDQTLSGI